MKKMSYFVLIIVSYFVLLSQAFADSMVIINGSQVRFRSGPTTNSTIHTSFDIGVELTYLETASSGAGCTGAWYKAQYGSTTGYVCSDYAILKENNLNPEDYTEYQDYLSELGFPESYFPYLTTLHVKYPNWTFSPMKIDITFDGMVSIEHDGHSQGWSLIEDSDSRYDGYKATDSWAYNYLNNVFRNNYEGGGTRWYAPNKQVIGYYLDPRNFLNEKQIFMFEPLTYNASYHTKQGVELALKGSFMEGILADTEQNLTYADAFIDASKKYNISPFLLVSRVIQEVGIKGSTIVSGTVTDYEGYYNFYNIQAYGNGNTETINNGLKYAKSEGWNTPYKAIVGGARFLGNSYVDQGQNTLYLQKWDLFGPKYGNHQYMQNIQAPASESRKSYDSYNNVGLVSSSFAFVIPVFKEMPDKTTLPSSKNPNNYLSTLSVNGSYLMESANHETEFELNLDSSATSVEIAATKVFSRATITGTGSVSLTEDKQTIPIIVKAENGAIRTYNINITRDTSLALDISEILRTLNIKNDGTYLYGYELKTDISTIIKSITDKEPKALVTVFDKNGTSKATGIIASGDIINIKTNREEKNYTIIIYGDVNSDGQITASDYMIIKNDIMDVKKMSDLEKLCADVNKDKEITASDYMTIKNHIMDVKKIIQ